MQNKIRYIAGLATAIVLMSSCLFGQKLQDVFGDADEMEIRAESMEADIDKGVAHAKGKVEIIYGQVHVKANEVWISQGTKDFSARGDVTVTLDDGTSWAAQEVKGNLATKALAFGQYGFDGKVWHSGGDAGSNDEKGNKKLENAWLTTCDHYPPHYRISASEIKHYPDNTFTAKHIVLKVGFMPVFYFPFLYGTTDGTSGMIIKPGYSSKKGAYLQLGRVWQFVSTKEAHGEGRVFMDLMSKRGIGIGSEGCYEDLRQEFSLNAYGVSDNDAPETEPGYNRRFESVENRYRLNAYYRYMFTERLSLRANIDWLSDIDMMENWFKREYRQLRQPKSFLSLNYDDSYVHGSISVRPRLNDFYTVVQKLPEATLDIPRVQLGEFPIAYQSSNSLGIYSMKWRDFDRKREDLLAEDYDDELHGDAWDYRSFRADTTHFAYLPLELGDSIEFIPRAGFKGTYYSRSSRASVSQRDLANMLEVDDPDKVYSRAGMVNYDSDGGEVFRAAFELGAELKTKLYSNWLDVNLDAFESDGLRHIVEPYANYTFSPDPSHNRKYLYFFDETDRLERQHFIRLGVDQRFQTRRNGQAMTLLRWQNYVDFHFDRGVNYGVEEWDNSDGRHPGDFGSRLDFHPLDRLHLWSTLLYDIGEGDIQRGELGTRLGREEELHFRMRYVYRNDHISRSVYSFGSTLVDFTGESSYYKKYFETADSVRGTIHIPLNTLTSFEIDMEYDFDKSRLSEHTYTLRRVMHCWVMSLGVGWDNGEFEAMIMLHLTAFPKVKLDLSL